MIPIANAAQPHAIKRPEDVLSTVRIYKVAELLNTTSQEVVELLRREHGIEVKSASSTIEEVVARQFVERLARKRGLAVPSTATMFSETPATRTRKAAKPAEPPPAAPKLGPPRLVKAAKAHPTEVQEAEAPPEAPAPEVEAPPARPVAPAAPRLVRKREPSLRIEEPEPATPAAEAPAPPAAEKETPAAPAEPAAAPAAEAAPAPAVQAPAAASTSTTPAAPARPSPAAPPSRPAHPRPSVRPLTPPATGRVVQPSMRLRVEDPATRAARAAVPAPPRQVIGGPRPLPSQPIRSPLTPARPSYQPTGVRPSTGLPPRPGMPSRPPGIRPGPRPGGGRHARRSRLESHAFQPAAPAAPPPITRAITLAEGMTVKDLADKLEVKVKDVMRVLFEKGLRLTINSTLDTATATMLSAEFGAEVKMQTFEEELLQVEAEHTRDEDLVPRAPVVTVMGHVDHGKTTLLDSIRETRVAEREAGGITQHIGAYRVDVNDRTVVFLDTPGHEAFTMMRARGARVTDVVVLVVAADDGVMPQTREAIDHAQAAGVPIVVAINKIDKPDANTDRVKKELADLGLTPEDWGGQTVMVPVSAKKKENLELLLEMILLVTDIGELKANPVRSASGTVLEAKLDRGRGPVATVLVQDGTLRVGDTAIAGTVVGKVRALIDDRGRQVKSAGPSTPVEVLGLGDVPAPGDTFQSLADAAKARQIALYRQAQAKEKVQASRARPVTLERLQEQLAEGEVKELALIIKADVQGSAEVLADTLSKLGDERVKVRVLHAGVGAINASDVQLASASSAIIIGFNVRPDRNADEEADRAGVDIRLHSVIYNITDEIKKAMAGLLEPTFREVRVGSAEVRQIFRVPKVGTVAGCVVTDGRITRAGETQARLLRDNVVVYEGRLGSLRRFKDDVSEVRAGLECGISFERYNDLKVGDVIEVFTVEQIAATV
jgi:translation initiation factor IF-2